MKTAHTAFFTQNILQVSSPGKEAITIYFSQIKMAVVEDCYILLAAYRQPFLLSGGKILEIS
jgi:hypothetical protein